MNTIVKLIIGTLLIIAGIAWYYNPNALVPYGLIDSVTSLKIIISGIVGLILIIFGLLLIWVELEEVKVSRRLKK